MTSFLSQIRTRAAANEPDATASSDAIAQKERVRAQAQGRHFGRRLPESDLPAPKRDVGSAARMIKEPYFRHNDLQPPPRDIVMRRPTADLPVRLLRR